jgi:4-oxalocrotonate tautomerase
MDFLLPQPTRAGIVKTEAFYKAKTGEEITYGDARGALGSVMRLMYACWKADEEGRERVRLLRHLPLGYQVGTDAKGRQVAEPDPATAPLLAKAGEGGWADSNRSSFRIVHRHHVCSANGRLSETVSRRATMPYVNIQITKGATREQKSQIVKDVTDSLAKVLEKKPEHTHVVIQEIEEQDWGFAGMLTDDWRKSQKSN